MKARGDVSLLKHIQICLSHVGVRPALFAVSALTLIVLMVGFSGHELARHIESLESWITQLGLAGILVFIVVVVIATSLFLPESVFGIAAGVLFGLGWGVAAILVANILAGVLQYGLAYQILREPIRRKLGAGPMSGLIAHAASGGNFKLQLLLRLAPLNQTIVSYSLGAAGVRFSQFLVGLWAALPVAIVEVYLGHTGKHIASISVGLKHAGWQHNTLLLAGLVAVMVGVGFASRAAYKGVLRAAKATSSASGPLNVQ